VAGRCDRDQLGDRIDPVHAAGGQDRREPVLPALLAEAAGIEEHVVGSGRAHPGHDRGRHDVARREISHRVDSEHDPLTVGVDEDGPFAADRLADQRLLAPGTGSEPEHGRVELHELEVTQHRTGPQCHRHPVCGRLRRIRGGGEHLTEPPTGEDDRAALHGTHAVALALAHHVQAEALHCAGRIELEVEGQRVLDDLAVGRVQRGHQGAGDLGAGGVTAGMGDAIPTMAALTGQRQLAGAGAVEPGSTLDQFGDRGRTLGDEQPHGRLVTDAGTGDESVVEVLAGRVAGGERGGDAALGPAGRARVGDVLGDHEDAMPGLVQVERDGEAGDAGPDDDDVGRHAPAGGRGG